MWALLHGHSLLAACGPPWTLGCPRLPLTPRLSVLQARPLADPYHGNKESMLRRGICSNSTPFIPRPLKNQLKFVCLMDEKLWRSPEAPRPWHEINWLPFQCGILGWAFGPRCCRLPLSSVRQARHLSPKMKQVSRTFSPCKHS